MNPDSLLLLQLLLKESKDGICSSKGLKAAEPKPLAFILVDDLLHTQRTSQFWQFPERGFAVAGPGHDLPLRNLKRFVAQNIRSAFAVVSNGAIKSRIAQQLKRT